MRRMQIGMWNEFSLADWQAFSSEHITGLEISQYQRLEELAKVEAFCRSQGFAYGIHAPAVSGREYPKITSPDQAERAEAFRMIREETEWAAKYGAEYVLFHYPFPPIFPAVKSNNFSLGGFEFYESEQVNPAQFREASVRLFEFVSELQVQTKQRIVLEYDFFGDLEHTFTKMFAAFPDVKLVVDVQRTDVQKRMFPEFDPYSWLDAVAPYVYLVHYSNTRFGQEKWQRHLPVLPHHEADPEYGDASRYLRYLAQRNDRFHLTFEHNPRAVSREELTACYELAAEIMGQKVREEDEFESY